ncbi:MAG: DISARM system phospholipase D-like protein DrmC [Coriobacteriia bacterium]
MISQPLLSHLTLMARTLPPGAVSQIAASISRGGLADGSLLEVAATPETEGFLAQLLKDWEGCSECSELEVASALIAANLSICDERAERLIEVVWSGPKSEVVPVRRIDQVLYQLIMGARRRLLIVSYAVYGVPLVLKAVNDAASRGVRVDLVLEFEGHDGDQEWDPLKALGKLDARVRVFEWPLEKRPLLSGGRRGMIHAKCAVADSYSAVVSSANLTEYAFDANMELGLRVEGATVASEIDQHFHELMNTGVLQLRSSR